MTTTEQQLRDITFNKLIELPAYKFKSKYQAEIKHLYRGFNNKTRNSHNRWKKFWFTLNSFYNKHWHPYALAITIISFAIASFDKPINSQISIVKVSSGLIFLLFCIIHMFWFAFWYIDIDSYFSLINRKIKRINKKVFGFKNNRQKALERRADEINLDYTWKGIALPSFVYALLMSLGYVRIFEDSLNDKIIWAANEIGFRDFDFIKNLTTQTIVEFVFSFAILLCSFIIILSLKKRRECLEDSLREVNHRLDKRSLPAKIFSWFS